MLKVLALLLALAAGVVAYPSFAYGGFGGRGFSGGGFGGGGGSSFFGFGVESKGFGDKVGSGMPIKPNGHPVLNPFTGHIGAYDVSNGLQNTMKTTGTTNDVTTDCRTYTKTHCEQGKAMTPNKCKEMKQQTYNPYSRKLESIGGACRWSDSGVEPEPEPMAEPKPAGWRGACLCPAVGKVCTEGRPGCHLHVDGKTGEESCIGKPERFYNQLAGLLAKRGKKDFSMRIKYGASGAEGMLPFGLGGPALVGRKNPYLSHHLEQAFGTFGNQGIYGNYGFAPSYRYRAGASFGGYGGYGPHGAYRPGAAAWSNPTSPHQAPFSQQHGYGAPWAPHFQPHSSQPPAPQPAAVPMPDVANNIQRPAYSAYPPRQAYPWNYQPTYPQAFQGRPQATAPPATAAPVPAADPVQSTPASMQSMQEMQAMQEMQPMQSMQSMQSIESMSLAM